MREYNKPTLEKKNYTLAKESICKVSDVVETESIDWTINGLKNGIK